MTLDPANAFHVARREYLENIRTRGFWISILLLPIVILLVSFAPIALREAESAAQYGCSTNRIGCPRRSRSVSHAPISKSC